VIQNEPIPQMETIMCFLNSSFPGLFADESWNSTGF